MRLTRYGHSCLLVEAVLAQLRGDLGLGDQARTVVGLEHEREPLGVEVVEVLVGDEDGVEAGELLETVRELAGVDEDAGARGFDQQARVSQSGEVHGPTLPRVGTLVAMGRVVIDVMPKPEILDPQGKAVAGALARLGFGEFAGARQGKRFELEVEGEITDDVLERAREAATTLLSNPVIEDVVAVRVVDAAAAGAAAAVEAAP